jgi:acyl dehydratase
MRALMSRYDELLAFEFPEFRHTYTERDTMLYALGVGAGCNPLDRKELRLVYEKELIAIPAMAVTLSYPGFWYRDLDPGLDYVRTLHGSEHFRIHRTLPVRGTVVARPKIVAIHDKGEGKGSLIVSRREIFDDRSGDLLASVSQTAFCRGDGGLGGPAVPAPEPQQISEAKADKIIEIPILPQAAMIYRLSGDYNPLHADPDFAKSAGFDKPVLHGLATYGNICRELMWLEDPERDPIVEMDCRFTGPVFPGESLSLHVWRKGSNVLFRASVGERRVIDNGICKFQSD